MELEFRAWDKQFKHYVDQYIVDSWAICSMNNKYSVHLIEQYSTLKDCDKTKIFKGDICELESGGVKTRGYIDFIDGCFCFCFMHMDELKTPELKYYIDMEFCTIKVVGNVHENADLLEVK